MNWEVQLIADQNDLGTLTQVFSGGDFSITEVNGEFILRSREFENLSRALC